MQHTPLEALPITGRRSERPWAALVASVAAHAAVIAVLLALFGRPPERPREAAAEPPAERTETVVLAPPLAPRPIPRVVPPRPVPRVPERDRPIPRPQVTRGPENIPLDPPTPTPEPVTPPPEPKADPGKSPGSAAPPPPAEVASAAAFEADTRRLFGRHDSGDPGGGGAPQPVIRWNGGPTEPRDNDCTPRPRPPEAAGQPVTLEFVEGWVYNERTGAVLAGAYLQMMGTPYNAFADAAGHYRLGFDRSLVDECRSQYVRVIAPGVPPQLIVLGRGPGGTNIYLRP
jgi:hypothetical protein